MFQAQAQAGYSQFSAYLRLKIKKILLCTFLARLQSIGISVKVRWI